MNVDIKKMILARFEQVRNQRKKQSLPQSQKNWIGPTNAWRLLDGKGDGPEFEGLYIDDFADRWLVSTASTEPLHPEHPKLAWLKEVSPQPKSIYWKALQIKEKASPVWLAGEVTHSFEILENALKYKMDFSSGYSQGIFLDQRDNRAQLKRRCLQFSQTPKVLNCFAYTCAFSVAAAAANAHTTSIDLSKSSLEWGKENFRLNGFDPDQHEFLSGDVFEWIKRLIKKQAQFDFIILDPPTFSRNRDGKVFKAAQHFGQLAAEASKLLRCEGENKKGVLFCSTNDRGMAQHAFASQIMSHLPQNKWKYRHQPMPFDFTESAYLQSLWIDPLLS